MVSRWSAPVWADTLFTCGASWEHALGRGRADEAKPTWAYCRLMWRWRRWLLARPPLGCVLVVERIGLFHAPRCSTEALAQGGATCVATPQKKRRVMSSMHSATKCAIRGCVGARALASLAAAMGSMPVHWVGGRRASRLLLHRFGGGSGLPQRRPHGGELCMPYASSAPREARHTPKRIGDRLAGHAFPWWHARPRQGTKRAPKRGDFDAWCIESFQPRPISCRASV